MYESQNVDLVVVEALAKSSFDGHSGRGMCSQWSCFSWISIETCDQFCKLTCKLTLRYVVGFMSGASTPRCQPSTSVANTTGARPNAPITRRRVRMAARLGAALSSCLFSIRKTASTPQYIVASAHGVKSTHGHQNLHKGAVRLQDNCVIKANAPKARAQRQRQNAISPVESLFPQILLQTKLHKHKYPPSSRHRNHCHMPLIGSDIPYSRKSAIMAMFSEVLEGSTPTVQARHTNNSRKPMNGSEHRATCQVIWTKHGSAPSHVTRSPMNWRKNPALRHLLCLSSSWPSLCIQAWRPKRPRAVPTTSKVKLCHGIAKRGSKRSQQTWGSANIAQTGSQVMPYLYCSPQ